MKSNIVETDFEKAKKWISGQSLDEDLILLDRLAEAPFPKEPRRMNFILIGLCTHGTVKYRMDMQERTITPGQMLIASERHVIDQYEASPDVDGLVMMISLSFYNEIVNNVSDLSTLFLFSHNHPVFELPEQYQTVFKSYFDVIKQRVKNVDNRFRHDLVRALMLALFYELSSVIAHFQKMSSTRQTRADIIFTKFIKMVEENSRQERRVGWYAQQLCITPKYLSEMVKQVSRRTPNEWIDSYVTLEARLLLKNTTMTIKQIAEELNFPNQSFLGKYFKEHVGMSPSEYRKS